MLNIDPKIWKESYLWEYEAYPFFSSVYLKVMLPNPKKYYSTWQNLLHYFHNGLVILYLPKNYTTHLGKLIIDESLNNDDAFLVEYKLMHKQVKQTIDLCLECRKKDEYLKLEKWWPATQKALSDTTAILFNFDFTADEFLMDLRKNNEYDFLLIKQYLVEDKQSFINEAGQRLKELEKKYPEDQNQIYNIFMTEYGWFQNSYKGIFHISKEWLENYAIGLHHRSQNEVSELPVLPEKYRLFIDTIRESITFKDDKKKLLLVAVELMEKWLRNICESNNWDYSVLRWLTVDEVLQVINGSQPEYLKKANGYSNNNSRCGVATSIGFDDATVDGFKAVDKLVRQNHDDMTIKGFPASKGNIQGRVRIVFDPGRDIHDFNPGDILVTGMTRPEFLPIMKIAGAIITDEGGISCHAAILARELKKPCIIGTKFATRNLKDGDLVEVDADNGIVKILL